MTAVSRGRITINMVDFYLEAQKVSYEIKLVLIAFQSSLAGACEPVCSEVWTAESACRCGTAVLGGVQGLQPHPV